MNYDIVLFDLDGTLLNTLEDLADSVNYVMEQMGYPRHSLEDIRNFVGNGIRMLMVRAIPDGENNPRFEEGFRMFQEYYLTHNQIKTRPYVGIMELLETLQKRQTPMAIVTNKNQASVDVLVRDVFQGRIAIAVGDDGVRARKPDPAPVQEALRRLRKGYPLTNMDLRSNATEQEWFAAVRSRVLYVGDSDVDAATAQNAGVDCALCTWGFRPVELLEALPHVALVHTPMELLDVIGE